MIGNNEKDVKNDNLDQFKERGIEPLNAFKEAIELVPPVDFSLVVPLDIQRKLLNVATIGSTEK